MTLKHFDPSKVKHVPMLERLGGFTPAVEAGLKQGSTGWVGETDDCALEHCRGRIKFDDRLPEEECGALVLLGQVCPYCGAKRE